MSDRKDWYAKAAEPRLAEVPKWMLDTMLATLEDLGDNPG